MEDNKPINELFDQFTNGELSGFESQTTKDLEISTPVGKHHSDDLKVNLSVLTKKIKCIAELLPKIKFQTSMLK